MARCNCLYFLSVLVFLQLVESDPYLFRKRQLVVGRVGFRPGRSLAIGRGAFFRPGGKRSADVLDPMYQIRPLGGKDGVAVSFREGYCTAERQQLADALFASIAQGMQELQQYAAVCYGNGETTDYQEQLPRNPPQPFEYVKEDI